jgi:Tc toxin complex TcA C-terminal TcB-binding domain
VRLHRLVRHRLRFLVSIQQIAKDISFLKWKQSEESTTSLLTSRASALERFNYYRKLLGLEADENAPDKLELDRSQLTEANFKQAYTALVEKYEKAPTSLSLPRLILDKSSSPSQQSGNNSSGQLYLTSKESAEMTDLDSAMSLTALSTFFHSLASTLALIPDGTLNGHFWGLGGSINLKTGTVLSNLARIEGDVLGIFASGRRDSANLTSKTASYERRADEWILQHNLAAHELKQIGRQILTSLIAEQIARHEHLTISKQLENSAEIDRFLNEKFSNKELYVWMQDELSRLYYEHYRFAFDTARKAEQLMKYELMRPEVDAQTFVKFNYWDGGRKGLLSGEALYLDLKRMEMAYHEHNKREFELTKHVSLRQLDPVALLTLKATGTCQISVPEWVYDLDCPGHYMRRIKMVALSIPSVVGPYAGVHCTLSLLKSSLRKAPDVGDGYARTGPEDERFVDYIGAVQSVVTSTAQNDTGLFEPNLRDERFLPFECAGAESTWKLELPIPSL